MARVGHVSLLVYRLPYGRSFPIRALRGDHDDTGIRLLYCSHRDENQDLAGRLVGHREQVNGSKFMFSFPLQAPHCNHPRGLDVEDVCPSMLNAEWRTFLAREERERESLHLSVASASCTVWRTPLAIVASTNCMVEVFVRDGHRVRGRVPARHPKAQAPRQGATKTESRQPGVHLPSWQQ